MTKTHQLRDLAIGFALLLALPILVPLGALFGILIGTPIFVIVFWNEIFGTFRTFGWKCYFAITEFRLLTLPRTSVDILSEAVDEQEREKSLLILREALPVTSTTVQPEYIWEFDGMIPMNLYLRVIASGRFPVSAWAYFDHDLGHFKRLACIPPSAWEVLQIAAARAIRPESDYPELRNLRIFDGRIKSHKAVLKELAQNKKNGELDRKYRSVRFYNTYCRYVRTLSYVSNQIEDIGEQTWWSSSSMRHSMLTSLQELAKAFGAHMPWRAIEGGLIKASFALR